MKILVSSTKLILFLITLFTFIAHGFIAKIYLRDIWKLRFYMTPWMRRYSRLSLKILGFHVKTIGPQTKQPFIVCNHMSYLDILILSSQIETCYVTSMEMKNAPVLGWATQVAGCLYVERRSKDNLKNEIQDVVDALLKGFHVTVFPEATSTNGEKILPFKKPLFSAAIQTQSFVQPLCLQYIKIDGKNFDTNNRDLVCWYGDMGFLTHLWSVMKLKRVDIKLHTLNPISIEPDSNVATLALSSHAKIAETYTDHAHDTLSALKVPATYM